MNWYDQLFGHYDPSQRQIEDIELDRLCTKLKRYDFWPAIIKMAIIMNSKLLPIRLDGYKRIQIRFYNVYLIFTRSKRVVDKDNGNSNDNSLDKCPIRILIFHAINLLICANMLASATANFLYARLLEKWNPQVLPGANRTELCAFEEDIYEPDLEIAQSIRYYSHSTLR